MKIKFRKLTKSILADLEKRGLIVPETIDYVKGNGTKVQSVSKKPGDVCGYGTLSTALKNNEISVQDALDLLACESLRPEEYGDPRHRHIERLAYVVTSNVERQIRDRFQ